MMKQLQLMDKLSPFADEVIKNFNERNNEFVPSDKDNFEEYGEIIMEMVSGAGIEANYEDGKVFIELN